jgi:hypothetical protein
MKILALYDIHGNAEALDAVLADPAARDADAVVVGGDVLPGPYAVEVLDRLEALDAPERTARRHFARPPTTPPAPAAACRSRAGRTTSRFPPH